MKMEYIEPVVLISALQSRKFLCQSEGGIKFGGDDENPTIIIKPDNPSDFGDL